MGKFSILPPLAKISSCSAKHNKNRNQRTDKMCCCPLSWLLLIGTLMITKSLYILYPISLMNVEWSIFPCSNSLQRVLKLHIAIYLGSSCLPYPSFPSHTSTALPDSQLLPFRGDLHHMHHMQLSGHYE